MLTWKLAVSIRIITAEQYARFIAIHDIVVPASRLCRSSVAEVFDVEVRRMSMTCNAEGGSQQAFLTLEQHWSASHAGYEHERESPRASSP
jgi:hypothetical protein